MAQQEESAGTSLGGMATGRVALCKMPASLAPPLNNARSAIRGLVTAVQLPESCEVFSYMASPDLPEHERLPKFLDCITEHAGALQTEKTSLLAKLAGMVVSPSSAHAGRAPSSATSMLELSKLTEGLGRNIRVYEIGAHFPTWRKATEAVSVRFHSSLGPLDQIPVRKHRLGTWACKLVEANIEVQNALTVIALLDAMEHVFKPREVECSQALSQFRPEWNRSSVENRRRNEEYIRAVQLRIPRRV